MRCNLCVREPKVAVIQLPKRRQIPDICEILQSLQNRRKLQTKRLRAEPGIILIILDVGFAGEL